ncbi:MAG: PEP-CTERM sorting domain-containing protein [Verrucomicrobiota bacterium]
MKIRILSLAAVLLSFIGNANSQVVANSNISYDGRNSFYISKVLNPVNTNNPIYDFSSDLVVMGFIWSNGFMPYYPAYFPVGVELGSYSLNGGQDFNIYQLNYGDVLAYNTIINFSPLTRGSEYGEPNQFYLGFKANLTGNSSDNVFGWIQMNINPALGSYSMVGNAVSYNNQGIIAGQYVAAVPEPSTYALCGLGLVALVIAYRRRLSL